MKNIRKENSIQNTDSQKFDRSNDREDKCISEYSSQFISLCAAAFAEGLAKSSFKNTYTYKRFFLFKYLCTEKPVLSAMFLDESFMPVFKTDFDRYLVNNAEKLAGIIDMQALEYGASYVIVAKPVEALRPYAETIFAELLFSSLKNVSLYDFLLVKNGYCRSLIRY